MCASSGRILLARQTGQLSSSVGLRARPTITYRGATPTVYRGSALASVLFESSGTVNVPPCAMTLLSGITILSSMSQSRASLRCLGLILPDPVSVRVQVRNWRPGHTSLRLRLPRAQFPAISTHSATRSSGAEAYIRQQVLTHENPVYQQGYPHSITAAR